MRVKSSGIAPGLANAQPPGAAGIDRCINVHSQKRISGNQPLVLTMFCFSTYRYAYYQLTYLKMQCFFKY